MCSQRARDLFPVFECLTIVEKRKILKTMEVIREASIRRRVAGEEEEEDADDSVSVENFAVMMANRRIRMERARMRPTASSAASSAAASSGACSSPS